MKITKIIFAFILFPLAAHSQQQVNDTLDKDKMDRLFSVIDENEKAMGSISFFQDGEEVYQNSFGYADVEKNIPATAKTSYRVGSVSKTFTACIIMQLVEENKLTLNTKLEAYFPEIPNAKEITMEHLLRHRSGLYNFTDAEDYNQWMEEPISQSDLIQKFVDYESVFSPGEKTDYCNTNYVLLSFIAEKIDGIAFSEILEERIVNPLKLNNTYYGGKINTSKNEALSYKKVKTWQLDSETDMSVPMGAGGVVSTPTELNILFHSLFNGKVVSDTSLSKMKQIVEGHGMGLNQTQFKGKKVFYRGGGIDGFSSGTFYFPDNKVSMGFSFNGLNMKDSDILFGALSIFYGSDYTLPEFKPALELSSDDLDSYLGTYIGPDLPFKITITKNDNVLIAQAPGQSLIPLESYETDKFESASLGVKFYFQPEENNVIFKMGRDEHLLTKEK